MTSSIHSPLDGHWQMVRAELDGEAAPELIAQRTELRLAAGRYTVCFDGQPADEGTFEIGDDPATRTIILHGNSGPNAGRTIPCIFQHVGERLRVCFGLDGIVPGGFSTAPSQRRYVATYRRK